MDTNPCVRSKNPLPEYENKSAIPTPTIAATTVTHLPILTCCSRLSTLNCWTTSNVKTVQNEFKLDDTVSTNEAINAAILKPRRPWGINSLIIVI
ncbi:hypothetical protein D3C87_1549060 [compost metagenome]